MVAAPMAKKTLKSSPEQDADDLWTWYVAFGIWAYQVCSNDDPKLTLAYLRAKSNLLPKCI